jgi:hypothetical protein
MARRLALADQIAAWGDLADGPPADAAERRLVVLRKPGEGFETEVQGCVDLFSRFGGL